MKVNEIVDEIQDQLVSVVEIAQEIVVGGIEALAEQAQHLLPEYSVRFANRLPDVAQVVDRGFERTEQWLRVNRNFASKVGDAFTPTA